jgi:phosphate-selective porin
MKQRKPRKGRVCAKRTERQVQGRFSWESGDKQHSISLSGRVHADFRSFDIDSTNANTADTFDIRRAYLGVSGKLYNNWTFEVTSDVANSLARIRVCELQSQRHGAGSDGRVQDAVQLRGNDQFALH